MGTWVGRHCPARFGFFQDRFSLLILRCLVPTTSLHKMNLAIPVLHRRVDECPPGHIDCNDGFGCCPAGSVCCSQLFGGGGGCCTNGSTCALVSGVGACVTGNGQTSTTAPYSTITTITSSVIRSSDVPISSTATGGTTTTSTAPNPQTENGI